MTTKKKFNKFLFSISMLALAICFLLCGQQMLIKGSVDALQLAENTITITNSDFNSSTSTALQSSPSGWTKLDSSSGKAGIITVKEEDFKNRASTYALESTQNPGKPYNVSSAQLDDHVLMINAKSSASSNENNNQGYKSTQVSLSAYSYYKVSIWVKTQANAFASIYLSGLEDNVDSKFEKIEKTQWTEYKFYVATGLETKPITIDLWLGTSSLGSYNAVFFDHVTMHQISENYFEQQAIYSDETRVIDYRDYISAPIQNPDFETSTYEGWTVVDHLPLEANAKVFNVNTASAAPNKDLQSAGSSLTKNNNYAFALYADKETSFGYKSTSFDIQPFEAYKISFFAKTINLNGSAYAKLVENNDILDFYGLEAGDEDNFYTPMSSTITLSTSSTSELTNDYIKYTFYVRGHELYKSSLHIELWLGNSDNKTKGSVVFDDFRFERISQKELSDASTTNAQTLTLTTLSGTTSVTNGTFNSVKDLPKQLEYPLTPSDWTYATSDTSYTKYGIVNTNTALYNNQKVHFGNILNPQNPNGISTDIDVNNVLMLWNNSPAYQHVTSSSLSLGSNKYYNITFDYKTVQQTAENKLLNVYLVDSDGNILYSDTNLSAQSWEKYTVVVRTTDNATSLNLRISLGTKENMVQAYAFVDNVKFEENTTMNATNYELYVQSGNALDFAIGNFNIISNEQQYSMYTPYRYTRKLENGTNPSQGNPIAFGGIVDGEDNAFGISNSPNNKNALKYMPVIRVDGKASYSLTAKDAITLTTSSYYKFSIDVYTKFVGDLEQADKEDDEKAKFGATFALSGLEQSLTEIDTNGEWVTYTTYVKATSDVSVYLQFMLTSETNEITGVVFFDNFKMTTIEEDEFVSAENYDQDKTTLVIGSTTTEEENPDENPEEDKENPEDKNEANAVWVLIPSLILAVALVMALVAYFMKKIKIKKWEKKKVNEYDRDTTLHRDVIRHEAEQQRQKDIAGVKAQIAEIEKEIEKIEEINKQRIKEQRSKAITRQTEKEFKAYANKHTKLENSISALNEKIATMEQPEYVLAIQKKIIANKVKAEKEAKKLK